VALSVERSIIIQATPERVLAAFFDAKDLAEWWEVVRSVTVPRPLGTYAIEWQSTTERDEVLGLLGGTFHGIVMDYRPASEFFVADAYWQPPEGEPIGPMALEIRCRPQGAPDVTRVIVRQSGEEEGPRWERYFQVVESEWERALSELKIYLDRLSA
jgi:uncharacterized protein YndB with AHSA1/START domain